MSEFFWTEQDVRDLLQGFAKYVNGDVVEKHIEDFKASKQPKPEWEIWEADSEEKGCSIHAVRRLSDGKIFRVGDIVDVNFSTVHMPIKGFKLWDKQRMQVYFPNGLETFLEYINKMPTSREATFPMRLTIPEIEKLKQLLNGD